VGPETRAVEGAAGELQGEIRFDLPNAGILAPASASPMVAAISGPGTAASNQQTANSNQRTAIS
jgi:hypothetical protein